MKQLIFICISLCFICCTKEEDNYQQKEVYNYSFYQSSSLEIVTNDDTYMQWTNITEGDFIVFEYQYQSEVNALIADQGYIQTIRFEIPKDLSEFTYKDDELINIKTTYSESCFCYFPADSSKNVAPKGVISGQKLSETKWKIMIDVIFYGDENQKLSQSFKLKTIAD